MKYLLKVCSLFWLASIFALGLSDVASYQLNQSIVGKTELFASADDDSKKKKEKEEKEKKEKKKKTSS